jgi:phage tail-like protein
MAYTRVGKLAHGSGVLRIEEGLVPHNRSMSGSLHLAARLAGLYNRELRMPPNSSQQPRAYAAAHFALELDGKKEIGVFRSIEGGSVKTDVMTYQVQGGPTYDRWRQLGKPKYEDIKLQVGMAMSEPFYEWIKNFFAGKAERKNGAILAADFYYKERARREFKEGMIKELVFPKLDAQDKNAAYMTVTVAVEDIVFKKGTGNVLPPAKTSKDGRIDGQKLWTCCNFRFSIHGFQDSLHRVTKVDSFTIKHNVIEYHMGGQLAPTKTPSAIEFPNIVFYIPEADAQPFFDYMTNKGNLFNKSDGRAPSGLHGSITTEDSNHAELFSVDFTGADILSITPDKADSSSEEIKLVKIELYTENMEFSYLNYELE